MRHYNTERLDTVEKTDLVHGVRESTLIHESFDAHNYDEALHSASACHGNRFYRL